jgi:S1-C subfamily serine protease
MIHQVGMSQGEPLGGAYRRAEQAFNVSLSLEERVLFQVLMTASGQSNAVPVDRFTSRLFNSIKRFQAENGLDPSGEPDRPFFDRLLLLANPMLDLWGFQWVYHPQRRHVRIWVPTGLGLRSTANEFGLRFVDQKDRMTIDFTTVSNVGVQRNFAAFVDELLRNGATIHYRVFKEDWFVISFTTSDGIDAYVRYHQDGANVTGFSLYWNNRKGNINGERVAVLMSASLRSSMSGVAFVDPPGQKMASAARSTPDRPIEKPDSPAPTEKAPRAEDKISTGTGFFVASDGTFVTNAHVIEGCSTVVVKTDDAEITDAKIIARDTTNDLAILRLAVVPKKIAKLRAAPRLGESVAAFGFPHADMLSSSGNFTLGNITALSGLRDDSRHLQISAPVQSGNSGGPLLDSYGNVVGVVALKLNALKVAMSDGDLPQNVNFAVKAAILGAFLDSNRVTFETAPSDRKSMDPADIAEQARAMSGFVVCK